MEANLERPRNHPEHIPMGFTVQGIQITCPKFVLLRNLGGLGGFNQIFHYVFRPFFDCRADHVLYYPQAALWVVGFGSLVSEFADGDTRGLFLLPLWLLVHVMLSL